MMQLLIWLSLVYAAVLVLALAGSLLTIGALLWRANFVLRDVRNVLLRVRDDTAPLQRQLGALTDAVTGGAGALAGARSEFERAIEQRMHPA